MPYHDPSLHLIGTLDQGTTAWADMGTSSSINMGPGHPDTCPRVDPSEVGTSGVGVGLRMYLADMIEDKKQHQLITNLDFHPKAGRRWRRPGSQLSLKPGNVAAG